MIQPECCRTNASTAQDDSKAFLLPQNAIVRDALSGLTAAIPTSHPKRMEGKKMASCSIIDHNSQLTLKRISHGSLQ